MMDNKNILFVDKPKGITSFDVIRKLRKKLGIRKLGHAGTLDPLATGLLIIGVGEGTKELQYFLKLPKTYEVEILLGMRTDTGDMEGNALATCSVSVCFMSRDCVRGVVERMSGKIELPVPIYSAIKMSGAPLYKRARRGEDIVPPVRTMEVRNVIFKELEEAGDKIILKVTMEVGSGAYVRSIAEEIGRRLGVPATVHELRRVQIGEHSVKDAKKLKDL